MANNAIQPESLYMVIDVTNVETTKIRFVSNNKRAVLLGQTYVNEHPGRKVIAPPLHGRSFSKLDKLQLQYLFWNTFGEKPNEDYGILLKESLEKASKLPVDMTEFSALEFLKASSDKTVSAQFTETGVPKPPKAKKESAEKPKTLSTCGFIWEICDKANESSPNLLAQDRKTFRTNVMQACEKEGINPSTAAVQFGKWEKNLLGSK
jgi:hypothetical protein